MIMEPNGAQNNANGANDLPVSSNQIDEKKNGYVIIAISIVLIIVAILLVTTKKFAYHAQNLPGYAVSYEQSLASSNEYRTSTKRYPFNGNEFLATQYDNMASGWKKLYTEAVVYIALHTGGALLLTAAGVVGLRKGVKKIKNSTEAVNGAD